MSSDDWFRSSTWDDQAKQLFHKKLARAGTQRYFYLKVKAAAISDAHPFDALKMFDEYIAADTEHRPGGNYSKTMVYLALGDINAALEHLKDAIGQSGLDMQAPALLEYVFLTGLHKKSEHYQRALELLEVLDNLAQNSAGRLFTRGFAGYAGAAFILYEMGRVEDSRHQAKEALSLAFAENGPIPDYPQIGNVPQLPKEWTERLTVISGMWDETELGPQPAV